MGKPAERTPEPIGDRTMTTKSGLLVRELSQVQPLKGIVNLYLPTHNCEIKQARRVSLRGVKLGAGRNQTRK